MSELLLRAIMGAWIDHTVRRGMHGVVGTVSRVWMYEVLKVHYRLYSTWHPGCSKVRHLCLDPLRIGHRDLGREA